MSIIFSHYDQNNDGLVEREELQVMWNEMDSHHVANDSNCTLMDMLVYDDVNDDNVLTINEFNDAFHRIADRKNAEIVTVSVVLETYFGKILSFLINLVNKFFCRDLKIILKSLCFCRLFILFFCTIH